MQIVKWLVPAFLLSISACTAQYTQTVVQNSLENMHLADTHRFERSSSWIVHSSTAMCMTKSLNREENERRRALLDLDAALKNNFQQVFPDLYITEAILPLEQAFKVSRMKRCELLVFPALVKHENQLNSRQELNEGKGLHPSRKVSRDEVSLSIEIYEVRTQRLLDVALLTSRQKYFAKSDEQATEILDKALNQYVLALTGRKGPA